MEVFHLSTCLLLVRTEVLIAPTCLQLGFLCIRLKLFINCSHELLNFSNSSIISHRTCYLFYSELFEKMGETFCFKNSITPSLLGGVKLFAFFSHFGPDRRSIALLLCFDSLLPVNFPFHLVSNAL